MGRRDPDSITLSIKSLLNTQNKLRRQGKIDLADKLAVEINVVIANTVRNRLSKLDDALVKVMWESLNQNKGHENQK